MEHNQTDLLKTCLYDRHVALGAKMVPFGSWLMPLQYKGIIQEQQAVRNSAGLFDVSHMGRILVEGSGAQALLDYLSTNKIKGDGQATYTVWCREDGSSLDDLIIYRENPRRFFVIANASARERDLAHLRAFAKDVQITPVFEQEGILALQGPKAKEYIAKLFPGAEHLSPMHFATFGTSIVAATGYTGEAGFEIFADSQEILCIFDALIQAGVEPIGLGARDILRQEMGYALYGHELSETIAPTESVSSWTVRKDKGDFLGKQALGNFSRHQYGIILSGKAIAREGFSVYQGQDLIGRVTSGTFSPTLNRPIAIILVDRVLSKGDQVQVEVRNQRIPAEVVKLPFLKRE